jgi:hypothetical protein
MQIDIATTNDLEELSARLGHLEDAYGDLAAVVSELERRVLATELRISVLERESAPTMPPPPGPLVFEDTFTGTALDKSKWAAWDSAGHAGNGLRKPAAFSVADGVCTILAHWDSTLGKIVSGGASAKNANGMKLRHRPGSRREYVVRFDPDPSGTMSGVCDTWPWDIAGGEIGKKADGMTINARWGELCWPETGRNVEGRRPVRCFIHLAGGGQLYAPIDVDGSEWHTYTMDWRVGEVDIFLDGRLAHEFRDAKIPTVDHSVTMQLDAFENHSIPDVRMQLKSVRVWQG